MAALEMSGLSLTPPADFEAEEVSASWRAPSGGDLKDPRALQVQIPVRPNLIVHRRRVDAGAELGALVSRLCADLARHIAGIGAIDTSAFVFDDGQTGSLLEYTIPAHGKFTLAQMQAARLDGDVFTTLTLSTELSRLGAEAHSAYLDCLASATPK